MVTWALLPAGAAGVSLPGLAMGIQSLPRDALVTAGAAPPLEQVGSLAPLEVRLPVETVGAGPPLKVAPSSLRPVLVVDAALAMQQLLPWDTRQSAVRGRSWRLGVGSVVGRADGGVLVPFLGALVAAGPCVLRLVRACCCWRLGGKCLGGGLKLEERILGGAGAVGLLGLWLSC